MKKLLLVLFFSFSISRVNAQNPAVDLNFGDCNNAVYAVKYDSIHGRVFVGGNFTLFSSTPRSRFASVDPNTGALQAWAPTFDSWIYDFLVVGRYLYVAGNFSNVNGSPRNKIAKFDILTQTLMPWNPAIGSSTTTSLEYYNGQVYVSLAGTGFVKRVDTAATATVDTWMATANAGIASIKEYNDYLYVLGSFTLIDGQPRGYIAAYDLTTSTPTLDGWAPDADARCNYIDFYGSNAYVSGNFSFIAGTAINYLAELNLAGTSASATGWSPPTTTEIQRVKVKGNQLYYFNYPNPMREIYLPTHTATTWSVNFSSGFAWDMYGFDLSATKAFLGGGWSIGLQSATKKYFAAVCARPYSPIISDINIINAPGSVCYGTSNALAQVDLLSGANTYTWTVSPSEAVTSYGDSAHITFSPTATATQYTISVDGSNGCMPTNTATTTVNAYALMSSITPQTTNMICGSKDTLVVSSTNYAGTGTVTYGWASGATLNTTSGDTVVSSAKTTVVYTLTSTSSDGCVANDTITIYVDPFNLNVLHTAQTILCSEKDTMSISHDYPGGSAVTYTWTPTSGLNLSNPTNPVGYPTTSTAYSLDASTSDGCSSYQQIVAINVTPLTLNISPSTGTITCGNSQQLNASSDYPGSGTVTYTWSPSAGLSDTSIANPVASPTTGTFYMADITTPEGCVASQNLYIAVDDLAISATGQHTTTCGVAVTIATNNNSGNPNLVYSWSPAAGLSSASIPSPQADPGTSTIYTVTISLPGSGCLPGTAVDTVTVLAPATPSICEVTSDSASMYNVVYWDKSAYLPTDSFIIYREVLTNTYVRIGAVPHSALSEYTDTARSIGPANGDPNIGTYRYKLAVKDSCGNQSPMSPYHNTVYFVDNQTGVFTWNTYSVENATTPVTQFNLMRDDQNNGVWGVVGTVTGTQTTLNDPNYALHQSWANWRVEALGFNCASTFRQGNNNALGSVVKSKSNITNNRVVGVKNLAGASIDIYPNPNSGKFMVELDGLSGNVSVKIYNMLGEEIYAEQTPAAGLLPVDISAQENGTYVIQVSNEKRLITKRIIKN